MFVSNETNLGDNLINIILEGSMMISVGLDTNISAICNMNIGVYTSLMSVTSMTTMKTYVANNNYVNRQAKFTTAQNGKWIHIRCGYNLENEYLYTLMTADDNNNPIVTDTPSIHNQNYYDGQSLDYQFQYFYTGTPNQTNFYIKNASAVTTTQVYMKNIQIFSDMIPKSSGVNY